MTRRNKMETYKFVVILLSYCVCSVSCYPAKPLNERSPELTWEAWLLVDDQNQNKQLTNSDGMLRRRITPKSIFIAPTFSPESLPACAEGYSSDLMGRCIKIIKLDQDAHYEFLIEKLKEKFSPADYEDYEDEFVSTAGPLQVNIPIEINSGMIGNEESDEETDIAIIVSPTKTYFDQKILNLDKRDSIDDEKKQELYLIDLAKSTTNKPSEVIDSLVATEQVSPVTTNGEIVTVTESGELTAGTTSDSITEQSTLKMSDIVSNSGDTLPTTTYNPISITDETTSQIAISASPSQPDILPQSTSNSNLWRFPDNAKVPYFRVKFPDNDDSFRSQIPSSLEQVPYPRGDNEQVDHLDSSRQSDDPVVFREEVTLDSHKGMPKPTTSTHRTFNRRNRDRHSGLFPPRWSQSNFQKPVVLRFSRKSAYFNTDQFKNQEYYRTIPTEDLAYLFKFKHKQPNQK